MEETLLHHTTFNLELSVYAGLKFLAEERNLTIIDVIRILMKSVSEEMKHQKMPKRLVEYQRLPNNSEWKIFHVRLTIEEYEHFVDMRKFFKKSVSHLIKYALETYGVALLNLPEAQTENQSDKKIFPHYSFAHKSVSGIQFFMICWGKPTERQELNKFL